MKGYILKNNALNSMVFNSLPKVFDFLESDHKIKISASERSRMLKALKMYGSTKTNIYCGSFEYYIYPATIKF